MYSRECASNKQNMHVETFENKSAINQMAKYTSGQRANGIVSHPSSKIQNEVSKIQTEPCMCSAQEQGRNNCDSHNSKGVLGFLDNVTLDDILLIFLIILFLTDKNEDNDFIVPILLIVLLLN